MSSTDFGFFQDRGFIKQQRKCLFYGGCIWARLTIAYLAYYFRNTKWLPHLAIIIGLFSANHNFGKANVDVWWNRPFHGVVSLLMIGIGFMFLYRPKMMPRETLSFLLLTDVLFGFVWSIWKQPYN